MSTKFRATTLALAVGVALGTTPLYAAEEADSAEDKKIEKIVVVGSRGAPRSVNDSPVPIDLIGGEELARGGNTDMLELLKGSVPSLNVHTNPISDAASLVKPANLRGLSSDSTLILVNGKRRHRASVIAMLGGGINDGAQGPDISVIPSAALKQVEVLRDGAAAQYGSDAIAGVMNMILKDNAEGVEFQVTNGTWMTAPNGRGGEADITAATNIGMPLSDNGFLNVSAEYSVRPELSRGTQHLSAADGYKGWDASWGTDDKDNVDNWETAMNWGRPENYGFRSV